MHSAQVRYDVQRARSAGLGAAWIARHYGVSPRSQRRIAHEEISFTMSDHDLHSQHRLGRPTVLEERFQQQIRAMLAENPCMKGSEVLRRLRTDHGYQAGKNPVYAFLRTARPPAPPAPPIVRFEGVAAEFGQFDFGTLAVKYLDDTTEKLTFFAGRLKYSRALHVCLVPNEGTEAFLWGVQQFAQALGGLPQRLVIDNAKSAVLKRTRNRDTGVERIDYNPHFAAFVREAGVFAEPTAPYAGNQKGSVENLIGFVKEGFLQARRFRHRADLERQLEEWLQYCNEQRPCDATGQIPALRLAEERPRLKPLPFGADGYGLTFTAVVHPDGRVHFDGCQYSAPTDWIGQRVTLKLHHTVIRLQHAGKTVRHPRVPTNGRYSLLPEHREALFVKPRGKIMAQRQILMDLCPEGEAFFTELVHRRPETWRQQDLPVVWDLFEQWGEQRLREAFGACVARGAFGGEYLAAWLSPEGLVPSEGAVPEVAA